MAVFTPLSRDQVNGLIAQYDIGDVFNYEGILQGVDNSNFKIETTGGRYILTIFEDRIDRNELPYFIDTMAYFSKNGVICPEPILRRDGQSIGTYMNKSFALFHFLDGRGMLPTDINDYLCFELGAVLARYHVVGQSAPFRRVNSMGYDAWSARLERVMASASSPLPASIHRDDLEKFRQEIIRIKSLWPHDLPMGNVHLDMFPDNVFMRDGHIYGVIDFYFSAYDILAYDLAIVMNAWCFEEGVPVYSRIEELLRGYQSAREITDGEKRSFQLLARAASMRFLTSRLHDWVFHNPVNLVTPKDPHDYKKIMEFHINNQVF